MVKYLSFYLQSNHTFSQGNLLLISLDVKCSKLYCKHLNLSTGLAALFDLNVPRMALWAETFICELDPCWADGGPSWLCAQGHEGSPIVSLTMVSSLIVPQRDNGWHYHPHPAPKTMCIHITRPWTMVSFWYLYFVFIFCGKTHLFYRFSTEQCVGRVFFRLFWSYFIFVTQIVLCEMYYDGFQRSFCNDDEDLNIIQESDSIFAFETPETFRSENAWAQRGIHLFTWGLFFVFFLIEFIDSSIKSLQS